MKGRATCGVLVVVVLTVLAAVWTGSATAAPPQRTVAFEETDAYTSQFCGDALIVEHDVGRITYTDHRNPDGSPKAFTIHYAAITQTLTNTATGATLTNFYSQVQAVRTSVDPESGAITVTASVTGLNFIIRASDEPPLVSAGRGVITFLVTFDANGNEVVTTTVTETPNLLHLTQLLCA